MVGPRSCAGRGALMTLRSLRPTAGLTNFFSPTRTASTCRTDELVDGRQRDVDRLHHVAQVQRLPGDRDPRPEQGGPDENPADQRRGGEHGGDASRSSAHSPTKTAASSSPRNPRIRPPVGGKRSRSVPARDSPVRTRPPAYAGSMSTPTLATGPRRSDLSDVTRSEATLRRFLEGLPGVDQVGAEARAASLSTRSIKTTAKAFAIDLAIRMVDLTTLEGQDTPGKVRTLCAKAVRPDPSDPTCPSTAAICVYADMVGDRERGARQQRRPHRRSRDRVPQRPRRDGHQARRHQGRRRGRCPRDRHGHRPGCVPHRSLPPGVRGDRCGARGMCAARRVERASQGDHGDR